MVAKTGSITRASAELRFGAADHQCSASCARRKFRREAITRVGRRLQLTEDGQVIYGYADETFSLVRELTDLLKGNRVDTLRGWWSGFPI
jgi:LysR family transcriptional regulator, transcriptional activator of nhaA